MFNKLQMPIDEGLVITQTLFDALSIADDQPLLFTLRDNQFEPTPAQVALAKEIILEYLEHAEVDAAILQDIASILQYMLYEFDTLAKYGEGTEAENICYIAVMYGVHWGKHTEEILNKYIELFGCMTDDNTDNMTADKQTGLLKEVADWALCGIDSSNEEGMLEQLGVNINIALELDNEAYEAMADILDGDCASDYNPSFIYIVANNEIHKFLLGGPQATAICCFIDHIAEENGYDL